MPNLMYLTGNTSAILKSVVSASTLCTLHGRAPPPPPPFLRSYKELVTKSLLSPPNIESLVSPRQVSMLLRDTKNVLLNGMLTSIYFIPLVSALLIVGMNKRLQTMLEVECMAVAILIGASRNLRLPQGLNFAVTGTH